MFDKYLICPYGFRNVISETGNIEGFELKIRIPYYRGVPLSCVDEIKVAISGGIGGETQVFTNDVIRFTVNSGSFMMNEMSTVATKRWNFDEDATLKIYKPGGLVYIDYQVEVWIAIRAPYGKFTGHDKKILVLEEDKYLTVKE
ncbi:hypothetical protein FDN13_11690 [Caloramator sp. E03]|uniref:C-glycoside deglycosidase beta subunit domain-containing protein n=1 Tax=Caloramator sp. E03 TaxID=2576307 RepID=UPI0011105355|nr:DUF6379 domain-containing protein [Caloramator sp. E03]QCX34309.1 hypothetical protein FDN13_11690 [Caloramator sp. E03]